MKTLLAIGATAVVAAIALFALSGPAPGAAMHFYGLEAYENAFLEFVNEFDRSYATKREFTFRLAAFKKQFDYVNNFDVEGMTVGINQFSDLTDEEFNKYRTGFIAIPADDHREKLQNEAKSSIDWRVEGAVTPVKNQGSCGSCWSFAAVAGMEGLHQIKEGTLKSFSEQQLVECSTQNNGCNGGRFDWAWEYHIAHGMTYENLYPYTAEDDARCTYKDSDAKYHLSAYKSVEPYSDAELKKAISIAPTGVAVGVDDLFRNYESGVLRADAGCTTQLGHAVTAVGYGTTSDGIGYYLIKNSWGTGWGDNGYIKLE